MSKNASKKKASIEVVFVLDRSGSMGGLEDDTIGGFNAMLRDHQEDGGDVTWTTVLFDDGYEVIHDGVPLKKMEPLTNEEYYVRGTTALLDAVGKTIDDIRRIRKRQKDNVPEKTLFVITTDGYENSSCEYSYQKVKNMIEEQQEEHGWEFIFLGANIDAIREGGRLGIRPSRSARYINDGEGIMRSYETVSRVSKKMKNYEEIGEDCLDEIRDDYSGRSKTVPAENGAEKVSQALQPKPRHRVRARSLKDYLE